MFLFTFVWIVNEIRILIHNRTSMFEMVEESLTGKIKKPARDGI